MAVAAATIVEPVDDEIVESVATIRVASATSSSRAKVSGRAQSSGEHAPENEKRET
jgi:hypothetical protein